jgi:hypothetical protein
VWSRARRSAWNWLLNHDVEREPCRPKHLHQAGRSSDSRAGDGTKRLRNSRVRSLVMSRMKDASQSSFLTRNLVERLQSYKDFGLRRFGVCRKSRKQPGTHGCSAKPHLRRPCHRYAERRAVARNRLIARPSQRAPPSSAPRNEAQLGPKLRSREVPVALLCARIRGRRKLLITRPPSSVTPIIPAGEIHR